MTHEIRENFLPIAKSASKESVLQYRKKRNMYPTKADFDNAVKQDWHSRHCLVAQLMKRKGIPVDSSSDAVEAFADAHGLNDLMHLFDKRFSYVGDEKTSPELIALREELPTSDEAVQQEV